MITYERNGPVATLTIDNCILSGNGSSLGTVTTNGAQKHRAERH